MPNMTNTFNGQTAKFLARVAENMPDLSGDAMQTWIDCPRALQKALYAALFLPKQPVAPGEIGTWKTVSFKVYQDPHQILMAFNLNNFAMDDYVAKIVKDMALPDTESELELVIVSPRELGFATKVRRDVFFYRAGEVGLDLVPAELTPQIRLAYPEQELGDNLYVGTTPVADSDGFPVTFRILCHGNKKRDLTFTGGVAEYEWDPDSRWIFARRKQQ